MSNKDNQFVIAVYVDNKSGVLTRVTSMFTRRGFNIDALTVGETESPEYSRITITMSGDGYAKEQMINQLAVFLENRKGRIGECCKALKDAGFAPARTIKLIAGCNEETGWKCIEHYNACAEMPKEGFSPDADFPVIYAEKGILHVRLDYPLADAPFTALRGGERENMVCDYARAEGAAFDPARGEKYGVAAEGDGIAAHGRAAHASTPEAGENALEKLLRYFAEESEGAARVAADLFDDRLGLRQLRDETGFLTLSPDVASYREGVLSVLADIRYPASMRREEILGRLKELGVPCTVLHAQAPLLSEKEGALVSTLRRVYEQETGQTAEPIAIGGGTYARALERGAAFGPAFPGEPSTIHQKDEYISLDNVRRLLRIYCAAIRALTEGEKKG